MFIVKEKEEKIDLLAEKPEMKIKRQNVCLS